MITLGTVLEATGTASVHRFLDELFGSQVLEVKRRSVRLEPPDDYWAVYRVLTSLDGNTHIGTDDGFLAKFSNTGVKQ